MDFIESKKETFVTTLLNDQSTVIIKEPGENKQTLEDVRMLAGSISKSLAQSNVEKATINDEILTKTYDSNEKQDVIIAFVEGWNLGTYKYVTYKRSEERRVGKECGDRGMRFK